MIKLLSKLLNRNLKQDDDSELIIYVKKRKYEYSFIYTGLDGVFENKEIALKNLHDIIDKIVNKSYQ